MHTGKQKQMNASYQASLVNRHIRRFTGSTFTAEVLPSNLQLNTSSFLFTCWFYKVFGRYLLCCVRTGLDWIQILGLQLDWTGLGSVAGGFGLDWIVSTQTIPYSGRLHISADSDLRCKGSLIVLGFPRADILFGRISGRIPGSISGSISGRIPGSISGRISDRISGSISGRIAGSISGRFSGWIPGSISGRFFSRFSGRFSGSCSRRHRLYLLRVVLWKNTKLDAVVPRKLLQHLHDRHLHGVFNSSELKCDVAGTETLHLPAVRTVQSGCRRRQIAPPDAEPLSIPQGHSWHISPGVGRTAGPGRAASIRSMKLQLDPWRAARRDASHTNVGNPSDAQGRRPRHPLYNLDRRLDVRADPTAPTTPTGAPAAPLRFRRPTPANSRDVSLLLAVGAGAFGRRTLLLIPVSSSAAAGSLLCRCYCWRRSLFSLIPRRSGWRWRHRLPGGWCLALLTVAPVTAHRAGRWSAGTLRTCPGAGGCGPLSTGPGPAAPLSPPARPAGSGSAGRGARSAGPGSAAPLSTLGLPAGLGGRGARSAVPGSATPPPLLGWPAGASASRPGVNSPPWPLG